MRARAGARTALEAVLLALTLTGAAPAEELLVGSAVSVREPVLAIVRGFETATPGVKVRVSFGSSSLLATQVRAGAPIDVFVSADAEIVDRLDADGFVAPGARAPIAGNRLVVVAARDRRLARPEDLRGEAIRRIAVPNGAVPVGRYARQWLAARGLLEELSPRIVETEHARATLAAVDAGHADAAIVYATDAALATRAQLAFEIPASEQPRIVYAAARLTGASPGAERLFDYLVGPEGGQALRAAGLRAP